MGVEFSFDELYRSISSGWQQQDDIPYPFGDHRECLVSALWIIDLDNDTLQLRKKKQNRRIPLSMLREGCVFITQMDLFDLSPLPKDTLNRDPLKPTWEPQFVAKVRQTAFLRRVLEDFSHQWRHVLRSRYNDSTFRRLARAILRLVTLDFRVEEVTSSRAGIPRPMVWLNDIPVWEPFLDRIIHFGRVSIVLCQHLNHATAAIQKDLGQRRMRYHSRPSPEKPSDSVTYIVLSVRDVFLCRASLKGKHAPLYTKPEALLNGIEPPSKRALEFLLMVAPSESLVSPVHNFPVEVQDMILREVSVGPVEAARIGCLFALGSAFRWESAGGVITRQEVLTTRTADCPIESHIWFDGYHSGLAYK